MDAACKDCICKSCQKTVKAVNNIVKTAVTAINNPENATCNVSDTKLYVPLVNLSIQDDDKLLQQLKTGFKQTIKWSKS